jgi:hypothetical protein
MSEFDNLLIPTPELVAKYQSGEIIGCYLDHEDLPADIRAQARRGADEFRANEPFPLFATAPKDITIVGSGKGKFCPIWHKYLTQDPAKAMFGAQVTGDCVSWGSRCASDITRCWEIWLKEPEQYIVRQATAMSYAARGHTGQGADPARIARAHVADGVLLEQVYLDGKFDFTDYSKYVRIGISYGRSGLPEELKAITRQNKMETTSVVDGPEEWMDALWNGYGIHYGFSAGVASRGDPISPLSGRTAHDVACVGFDDSPECIEQFGETVFFFDQSWGNWNNVTNIPERWKPWGQGMYALKASSVKRQGMRGHCYSKFKGYPAQPFDNLLI